MNNKIKRVGLTALATLALVAGNAAPATAYVPIEMLQWGHMTCIGISGSRLAVGGSLTQPGEGVLLAVNSRIDLRGPIGTHGFAVSNFVSGHWSITGPVNGGPSCAVL